MSKDVLFSCYPELKNVSFTKDGRKGIQSFVLRTNPLSQTLTDSVINYYKDFALPYNQEAFEHSLKFNFDDAFKNGNKKSVIEIGFGSGSSFVKMAEKNPCVNYLGFEVYLNGFAECLSLLGEKNLTNARVMRCDVMPILEKCIEKESIDGFNIFFPDPWPKKKHHKRRIINTQSVALFASLLKRDGFIHFATDIEDYAYFALSCFENNPSLKNKYKGFAPDGIDREESTFEQKALECGRQIFDIYFMKK